MKYFTVLVSDRLIKLDKRTRKPSIMLNSASTQIVGSLHIPSPVNQPAVNQLSLIIPNNALVLNQPSQVRQLHVAKK